jgi:hypothetical protein
MKRSSFGFFDEEQLASVGLRRGFLAPKQPWVADFEWRATDVDWEHGLFLEDQGPVMKSLGRALHRGFRSQGQCQSGGGILYDCRDRTI